MKHHIKSSPRRQNRLRHKNLRIEGFPPRCFFAQKKGMTAGDGVHESYWLILWKIEILISWLIIIPQKIAGSISSSFFCPGFFHATWCGSASAQETSFMLGQRPKFHFRAEVERACCSPWWLNSCMAFSVTRPCSSCPAPARRCASTRSPPRRKGVFLGLGLGLRSPTSDWLLGTGTGDEHGWLRWVEAILHCRAKTWGLTLLVMPSAHMFWGRAKGATPPAFDCFASQKLASPSASAALPATEWHFFSKTLRSRISAPRFSASQLCSCFLSP